MTILWIPHSPSSPGSVRRDEHLIRHLQEKHRIISTTWETGWDSPVEAFTEGLRFYPRTRSDGRREYHVRRVPDITRRLRRNKRDALWLNQAMFRRDVRHIIEKEGVDVLITAYSGYMTGHPPFDVDVPVIFDYLDCAEWESESPHVQTYLKEADLVLAVSALAEEQARRFNDHVVYLPNGADVQEIRQASGKEVRSRYGLEGATVVSLIGLMDTPYLVEAVLKAKKQITNLKCLLVGESDYLQSVLDRVENSENTFISAGVVPYRDVPSYLAASDVGIYPVPGISYDDGRSPIKIFEYTAAGCPVVTPPIREVTRLDFSNFIYASPEVEDFASGIVEACRTDVSVESNVERYSWQLLASKLDDHIKKMKS